MKQILWLLTPLLIAASLGFVTYSSSQTTDEVRNPVWCFQFRIGNTQVTGNVCEPTEQLCEARRERVSRDGQGNVPCGPCVRR